MSDQNNTYEGAVLPPKAPEGLAAIAEKLTAADAFGALRQIVDVVRESLLIHEAESTKREKLRTYRETEVARIEASERILREYFDRVFAERRETHAQLFASLNLALASGDVTAIQTVVGGIVEVARTSPLGSIGNLGELRRVMDDPNTVFEF